ncbi:MAG TPA: tetratricopeptide repeat protein, partial [Caulobacteraceae bacterium]|nr:tetratricopeptide repeat protein [Caulobacteraceae bacterium]
MSATEPAEAPAGPDVAELWAEVKRLRRERMMPATIPILERLCAERPGDLRFLVSVAEAHIESGQETEARSWLDRAAKLDPDDQRVVDLTAKADARWPSAESLAALEAPRAELRRTLERLASQSEHAALISAYHAVVRERPEVVADIEAWAPQVNAAGGAIWQAAGERPSAWAQAIIHDVHERGICKLSFDEAIGDAALMADLQEVVRTTQDWTVPGKPHFFKAVPEDEVEADHPILRAALHPRILEVVNGFYGLHARLVSANIVQTRTDPAPERRRRSSEGWHRDPEDTPMLKCFFYLNDVLEIGHGPFQYIPSSRPGGKYERLLTRFGRGVYDK